MPSWETIGIYVGGAAGFIAALTLISLVLSYALTGLIREFRKEWEKADPRREEKKGKQ